MVSKSALALAKKSIQLGGEDFEDLVLKIKAM